MRLASWLGILLIGLCSQVVSAQTKSAWNRYEFTHPQMGTIFRLIFYAQTDSVTAAVWAKDAFDAVDSLNASMSDYLPESELNRLSKQSGTGFSVPVSANLWQILYLSEQFSAKSQGAFDVTIGPLTRLWRRARNLKEVPDSTDIRKALAAVGNQYLICEPQQRIRLQQPGMRLDLGGIAQGFAADRCLKVLRKYGVKRALADAGGDIALGDPPPGQKGWDIETPGKPKLKLSNCGITTSGATYRYLEVDGRRYSHIVDPRTGWGLTHRVLVTVKAPDATTADAWATAISVLGQQGWQNLPSKPKRLRVWLTEDKL